MTGICGGCARSPNGLLSQYRFQDLAGGVARQGGHHDDFAWHFVIRQLAANELQQRLGINGCVFVCCDERDRLFAAASLTFGNW